MRHQGIVALAIALSGCIMTPEEVRKDGRIYKLDSALLPSRAAACIARSFEDTRVLMGHFIGWHTTSVRDGQRPSTTEVVVNGKDGTASFNLTYVDVVPSATGSSVTTSFQLLGAPEFLQDEMFALLKTRCATAER